MLHIFWTAIIWPALDRIYGLVTVRAANSKALGSIPGLPNFLRSIGAVTGPLSRGEINDELLERKSSGSSLAN
jgi:hypothetical protein